MQVVISTIICFIVIGGLGMYFGNKKVESSVARQRWLKYAVYILLTSFVVVTIWFQFFLPIAILIILFGYYELTRTIYLNQGWWLAVFIYTLIAGGFLFYAWTFKTEFQFFIYLQILSFDAFSQVTGQLVGKTPITPRTSPTKTLEGLSGGIFFCVLASVLISNWMNISFFAAIMFGLFTAITGFSGDILASFYKRIAKIKDYSNLLPGQGGFLDRFDSFMMAAFCYSIIYFLAPGFLYEYSS
jgi:phosphatidate cytidylyltransferase